MNATSENTSGAPEGERHWTEDVPAFWDVVRAHMDRKGIEDVEELHRRFLETTGGYIPVPGRHRGKPVPLEEFKRHVAGEHPNVYGELIRGLAEVLDIPFDRNKESDALILSYMWGRPRFGIHPTRELR